MKDFIEKWKAAEAAGKAAGELDREEFLGRCLSRHAHPVQALLEWRRMGFERRFPGGEKLLLSFAQGGG